MPRRRRGRFSRSPTGFSTHAPGARRAASDPAKIGPTKLAQHVTDEEAARWPWCHMAFDHGHWEKWSTYFARSRYPDQLVVLGEERPPKCPQLFARDLLEQTEQPSG